MGWWWFQMLHCVMKKMLAMRTHKHLCSLVTRVKALLARIFKCYYIKVLFLFIIGKAGSSLLKAIIGHASINTLNQHSFIWINLNQHVDQYLIHPRAPLDQLLDRHLTILINTWSTLDWLHMIWRPFIL